ncbi:glutamyl-tRNA reductase [Sporichthya polymorpha]|uniref:glutamyl-tRNA reductase n=1 Tax=Sporichthya polymorpha TaxID=35751 RepID=UPI00037757AE|nr:glutamyl-tRNA reductase [Sporichthya polymorpha]
MNVLVIGLSHRTAPVRLLERVALTGDALNKLLSDALASEHVAEVTVLSTCNRVEVYAVVDKFHGGLADLSEVLCRHTAIGLEQLRPHLYVHYEDRAVQHLFSVACGLDSMVVGESQILGQVRAALAVAQDQGGAGRVLNELVQRALRVGKRARTETGIDRAGRSLVSVGLDRARAELDGLAGRTALVVGAGSMSALAATVLADQDLGELVVANRTYSRAQRLAAGLGGRAIRMEQVAAALSDADLVVSCTGASELVLDAAMLSAAADARGGRAQFLLDLALPRDIDPAAAALPGVTLVDLEALADADPENGVPAEVEAVRRIVAAEVAAFAAGQRANQIAPTVVALRTMADDVVHAEMLRLEGKLPGLDARERAEIAKTVKRVVDKLMHGPTVRVKELASGPDGETYTAALRELFNLDRTAVEAVMSADLTDDVMGDLEGGAS